MIALAIYASLCVAFISGLLGYQIRQQVLESQNEKLHQENARLQQELEHSNNKVELLQLRRVFAAKKTAERDTVSQSSEN